MKNLAQFSSAILLFAAAAYAQQPRVLINEILYQPDSASTDSIRTHDWVELYNPGKDGVSLAGWTITARDGLNGPSARGCAVFAYGDRGLHGVVLERGNLSARRCPQ